MRETDLEGNLFTWSRSRRHFIRDCRLFSVLFSSLHIFVILNLFVTAAGLCVGNETGTKSLNCCGMRTNTSKCWTSLACACRNECVDANIASKHQYYRLEFCSSFPLTEVLSGGFRNCSKELKELEKADSNAKATYKSFEEILKRIDCGENWKENTYSATSTCQDCMEAYKNWICFALVSNTSVWKKTKNMRRPCLSLCKSVVRKCPYLLPAVPSDGDVDNLVQIGYSAFNCITEKEWEQEYKMDSEDCLNVDQMDECQQNNQISTSPTQPTMSSQIPTTSNSTNIGNR